MFTNSISFQICINILISIIIIYIVHHILNYLKTTYSNQISKDLVNSQLNRYKKIMKELQVQNNNISQQIHEGEVDTMNTELLDFMKLQE
jgi:hypothetical protein